MSRHMEQATVGELTLTSCIKDASGNIVFASGGTTAPTGAGYAGGAYYAASDGKGYINKGDAATANFTLVTQAA